MSKIFGVRCFFTLYRWYIIEMLLIERSSHFLFHLTKTRQLSKQLSNRLNDFKGGFSGLDADHFPSWHRSKSNCFVRNWYTTCLKFLCYFQRIGLWAKREILWSSLKCGARWIGNSDFGPFTWLCPSWFQVSRWSALQSLLKHVKWCWYV